MAGETKDPAVVEYLRQSASRAGKARLVSMTAERRKEIAKLAALARWRKKNGGGPEGGGSPNGGGERREAQIPGIMSTPRKAPKPCRTPPIPTRKAEVSLSLFDVEAKRAA